MGHLTKIKYIADCLKNSQWPSWFPYWYNGSTVIQYYPPLSYLLLVPVQIVFDSVMITFKFFLFFSQFIGALGVWYFCYRFIGPWIGIIGGIFYALQPFLLRSLLLSGVIAQGPVFALTPWLLFFTVLLFEKITPVRWLLVCVTVALLILSHPMHAFLVSLCTGVVVAVLFIQRKNNFAGVFVWIAAVALGSGLVSFWWVPGVTQLETPGIPFLLPEASAIYYANLNWFNPASRHGTWFYCGLSVILLAFSTVFLFRKKRNSYAIQVSLLGALLISLCISFGLKFPLFKYLPMHKNLVPGRVLSFSALAATILCIYLIKDLVLSYTNSGKAVFVALIIVIIVVIAVDINPYVMPMHTESYSKLQQDLDLIPVKEGFFDEGRFGWVFPVNSDISYFPMLKGYI